MHSPRTTPHSPFRCPSRILLALLVAVGLSTSLHAATYDYIGSGGTTTAPANGFWATAASWNGGTAPTSSLDNILTFGGSGSGTYESKYNVGAGFKLNQIILNSTSTDVSKITTSSGGTLDFVTNSALSGPRITQNGTGNFLFTGLSTLTDTLTIDGTGTGTMQFSSSQAFSGTGGIIMSGAGVLKLSEYNSFTGGLTINSGAVDAGYGNTNRLGSNAVTLAGGTLILSNTGGTWGYASTTVTADSTMVSNRNGAGAGGTNTVSGPLTIGTNTLTVKTGALVTGGTAGLKFSGGTTLTGNATFSVDSATLLQLGVISGASSYTLTKSGAGELNLNGDNTDVAELIIKAGAVTASNDNSLKKDTVAITIDGGTLDLSGRTSIAGLITLKNGAITGNTTGTIRALTGTAYDLQNGLVSKVLAGTGIVLTKSTAGTVTLSAVNTYTGATILNGGTLLVDGSISASSAVALNAATLGGGGSALGTVTAAGTTSVFSPGVAGVGTFTVGALDATAGASFNFDLGTSSDLLAITGEFTGSTAAGGLTFNFNDAGGLAAGDIYTLLTFGSKSGLDASDLATGSIASGFALDTSFGTNGYLINDNDIQVRFAPIPEPATWALLLGAAGLMVGLTKRRRA